MKLITYLLLPLILSVSIIFYSCGSDTVTNITNPPSVTDSLIYSLDSLASYLPGNPVYVEVDSLHSNKYRFVFDGETNDTSQNTSIELLLNRHGTDTTFLVSADYFGNQVNSHIDKTLNTDSPDYFIINIILNYQAVSNRYIRIKNIKVYLVH